MDNIILQMSKDELREIIEEVVDQKLCEFFGDPDEGLPIREAVRQQLLRQQKAFENGEPGRPFEEVVKELGL